ncbi:MAG: ABC transporter substrate-binding protein [Chloroflexi bacterium]|nr:ABC transporter substrate-binding protein [Chloroflexota bacterium]
MATPRALLTVALVLVGGLLGCSAPAASSPRPSSDAARAASAPATPAPRATESAPAAATSALTTVQVASVGAVSDVGLYVAMDRGYFAAEGLQIELSPTDGISRIISALSTNQVDVAGGTGGAALFNAFSRNIPVKLVADKGRLAPGFGYFALTVRQDLVDSGQVRTVADLHRRVLAVNLLNTGSIGERLADLALARGNLTRDDVTAIDLTYTDMTVGFGNRGIDAAIQLEPMVTAAVAQGLATRLLTLDEVSPDHQVGVLMYGPRFAASEEGHRFLVAYLRGVRDYHEAFTHGRDRTAIIDILTRYSTVKDPALYELMVMPAFNPDGYVNRASIQGDYDYYRARGFIQQDVRLDAVVDDRYVESALQRLGRYQPRS